MSRQPLDLAWVKLYTFRNVICEQIASSLKKYELLVEKRYVFPLVLALV